MELKDLVGMRILTGVDFSREEIDGHSDCDVCRFELDGIVYQAIEDPDDGYRSHMRELTTGGDIANRFPPHIVLCKHMNGRWDEHMSGKCDVLQIIDCVTGGIILEVGTADTDDYYPYYMAHYSPQNLRINHGERQH